VFTGGAGQSFTVDFSAQQAQGLLSSAQAMFFDAADLATHNAYVQFSSGQRVACGVGTQGYVPVISGTPLAYTVVSPLGSTGPLALFFMNFQTDAVVWSKGT
jgi:hypothetical protein